MREIIFVSGIHGSGKSTFCRKLSNNINFDIYSCSDLIRKYKTINSCNKLTDNISHNQTLLQKAVDEYLDENLSYILDGHFTLLDSNSNIIKIPKETFENLGITKVIFLNTPIYIVYNNLKNRDNICYSKKLLEEFHKAELSYCKQITSTLNLPLEILNPYN